MINVSLSVSLSCYALWAFQFASLVNRTWIEISLLPAVIVLFRYTWIREKGKAEAPEELIFSDAILMIAGLFIIFSLWMGIY
jgi:hypothetical protein